MFNKKHDVLPCISVFDQDSIRRMITTAADVGKNVTSYSNCQLRAAADVCYARTNFPDCPVTPVGSSENQNTAKRCTSAQAPGTGDPLHHPHTSDAFLMDVQTPLRVLGPIDFSKYLHARYLALATNSGHLQGLRLLVSGSTCLLVKVTTPQAKGTNAWPLLTSRTSRNDPKETTQQRS